MPHISVTCPHCATRNDIHASEAPQPIDIHCSRCHKPLGRWSELERRTLPNTWGNGERIHNF